MRTLRWILITLGIFAAVWVAVIAANTTLRYLGLTVAPKAPEELSAALRQYYRVAKPEGPGPFPTALLFSGCDGPQDNLDRWSAMLVDNGWAAVVVDSHGPRDYQDFEVWRLICAGQLLFGSERAGDVLIAINDALHATFVDRNAIVLIGASHGGWAIMELLAFEQAWELPPGLTELPDAIPVRNPLESIVGQILLYPYCGIANRARKEGWRHPSPTLFLLSGNDMIAPAEDCLKVIDILEERGLPVETHVFESVTHGFDQSSRSSLSPLEYDAAATAEALQIGADFLDSVLKDGKRSAE